MEQPKLKWNVSGLLALVLFTGSSLLSQSARAGGGSDVGNGGLGGSTVLNIIPAHLPHWDGWCESAGGMLQDALQWARFSGSLSESRAFLVDSIRNLLASYEGQERRFQPLTYTFLATVLEIDRVFPQTPLGHQTAVVVLHRFISNAIVINREFDIPRFVPWVEHFHERGFEPVLPMAVDGISAIRALLSGLFEPALADRPNRGSILDAMGTDDWELRAVSVLMGWVERTLEAEIFGRRLACLHAQVHSARTRLDRYLSGIATAPFDSRLMRTYVESTLEGVLNQLDTFDGNRGVCGSPRR